MDRIRPVPVLVSMICAAVVTLTAPSTLSAQTVQVLHSFSGPDQFGENNDGAYPRSSLVPHWSRRRP